MHVRVAHPVPVRVVPRGGRHERLAFAPRVTEAEIPEIGPSAFEPLGFSIGAAEFFLRDGDPWRPVPINPAYRGAKPDAGSAFASWLSADGTAPHLDAILTSALRRTPLVAVGAVGSIGPRPQDVTLRLVDPLPTVREIRDDLGDRASAGVRDLLGRDFAIVDSTVMMRCAPLATHAVDHHARGMIDAVLHPHAENAPDIQFGLERAAGVRGRFPNLGSTRKLDYALLDTMLKDRVRGGYDRTWFVNAKPRLVHAALSAALARRPGEERARALAERLRPIAELATIGLVDEARHPDAFDLVAEGARVAEPLLPSGHFLGKGLSTILFLADGVITPATAPDPGDLVSLDALAP